MDCCMNIFDRKEIWALIGVVIAFLLTEIGRSIRKTLENRRLRKALFDELETNYFQLEHTKNTIKNVLDALNKKQLLPATNVPSATAVFDTNLSSIIKLLKPIERDDVQNIYGRLHILDRFLADFEEKFSTAIRDKVVTDPWSAYTSRFNDIKDSCSIVQELILSVLDKKPIDLYGRKNNVPIRKRTFAGVVTPEIVRKQRGG
jgi:hypothetical protein